MRLFFKVLRIPLVLLVILPAFLSGCNVPEAVPAATSTPESTPVTPQPTATKTPLPTPTATPVPAYISMEPSEYEGTTLVLRYSLDGSVRDRLQELVSQFNEENTDGLKIVTEPAASREAFLADASACKQGQLLIAESDYLRSISANGPELTDLSDFMNDPTLTLGGEGIQPVMQVMLEQEDRSGSYFALPLWTEPAFLFYNKTWAQELGYPDTPQDMAAFAEQACAAGRANYADKDDARHGTGGWIISADTEDTVSWLLAFAGEGQTVSDLMADTEGHVFTDAAAWLRNLYDNGCAWTSRVKEPYDYFANRYALFYSGTYSDAERQFNAFGQSESFGFDNWDLIAYPGRAGGRKTDPRIFGTTVSIAVPAQDPKEIRAAWQFIRWLYGDTRAASLALAAGGWPVQDDDAVTRLYRNSGEDKLYQSLSWRQYLVPNRSDGNWLSDRLILSDGFAYIFNPAATADSIPLIWEQIGEAIAETNSVTSASGRSQPENTSETGGKDENKP